MNLVPRLQPHIDTDLFYEACLIDSKDDSLSVLFLTHTQICLIHSHSGASTRDISNNTTPFTVKWLHKTSEIKYIDIIDEKKISIGFKETCVNLFIGDSNIAERIRAKVDKIIKSK